MSYKSFRTAIGDVRREYPGNRPVERTICLPQLAHKRLEQASMTYKSKDKQTGDTPEINEEQTAVTRDLLVNTAIRLTGIQRLSGHYGLSFYLQNKQERGQQEMPDPYVYEPDESDVELSFDLDGTNNRLAELAESECGTSLEELTLNGFRILGRVAAQKDFEVVAPVLITPRGRSMRRMSHAAPLPIAARVNASPLELFSDL